MRLVGMRLLVIVVVGTSCNAGHDPMIDVDAPAQITPDASPSDGPAVGGCPDALFGSFVLPKLQSHSNVCVDSATCTVTRTGMTPTTCDAHIACQYAGAGAQSYDVTFAGSSLGWTASTSAGTRHFDWTYHGGMAMRSLGDLTDEHVCVFTDGGTAPVFHKPAGACPDLTRTYLLRQASPHSCSSTLRCAVIQRAPDSCVVDTFCTFPTGGHVEAANVTIAAGGTSGAVVANTTTDPMYPERYELHLTGDFVSGTGASTNIATDYFFNAPATPTCSWIPNGPF